MGDIEHERRIRAKDAKIAELEREAAQMRRTAVRHAQDAAAAHEQLRRAVDLLREFDGYASADALYDGSPFETKVRAFLDANGGSRP